MKHNTAAILFFAFLLFLVACYPKTKIPDEDLKNAADSAISEISDTSNKNSYQEPDSYTKNPIYLSNNKIYVDSLSPFFKHKNLERMDLLSEKLENWYADSLKEIVFNAKKLKFKHRQDTVSLGDYQFIVGSAKLKNIGLDYIILLDYYVEWGYEVILASIDKNHDIIDIQGLGLSFGDGGESYKRKISYKDLNTYIFTEREENWVNSDIADTLTYNVTDGIIVINSNGTFKKNITKKSGDIIEIRKVKK